MKKVYLYLLMLIVVLSSTIVVYGDDKEDKTYKVAYMGFDSFIGVDDEGKGYGYAGEYLNDIANEMDIKLEYVYVPFDEVADRFFSGEFHIYAGIPLSENNKKYFTFCKNSMGHSYIELFTLKEGNEIAFNDYKAIEKLKIGYIAESNTHVEGINKLKEMGVNAEFVAYDNITYAEYEECLKNREVDAIISTSIRYNPAYTVIARLDNNEIYFAVSKGNNELKAKIDEGMKRLMVKNPRYKADLYFKYFSDNNISSQLFSIDEKTYIANNPDIFVNFSKTSGFLSEYEEGRYYGIQEDFVSFIANQTGFNINIVEDNERVNLIPDYIRTEDALYNTEYDLYPYLTTRYYLVKDISKENNFDTIIVEKECPLINSFIPENFPNSNIVYADEPRDCFDALIKGNADIAFVNSFVAEYYIKSPKYNSLTMSYINYNCEICMAVPKNMPILSDIIKKVIERVTASIRQEIVISNTVYMDNENAKEIFLYRNYMLVYSIISILIILFLISVVMTIRAVIKSKQKKQLDIALEEVRKASRAKADFLSRMSHDIRTPLNGILGMTKITLENKNLDEGVRNSLKKIDSCSEYLLGLLNDILDMNKIENDKIELHEEVIDGPEFLKGIEDIMEQLAKDYGVELVTDFNKISSQWIVMDKLRTQQIYMNLLSNAIKYSKPGNKVYWTIADEKVDDNEIFVTCTIKDNGCGMSEEFLKKVYLPFEREDNEFSSARSGSGLGLAIAKNLITTMGGDIEIESKLNVGTTVVFRLRRKILNDYIKENEVIKQADCGDLTGKRIILCEDNPLNVEIAMYFLENAGIEVDIVDNGKECVELFENSKTGYYDGIIMDIRMPIMDGLTASKIIRGLDREDAKKIPIIAMTANAFEEDIRETKIAGMSEYISKPINVNNFISVLKRQLC